MMTYESESEAQVLKQLWRPDAPLENTVFAILDPWARPILLGGRSPIHVFRDSADMARAMNDISRHYVSAGRGAQPDALPAVDTLRLAIDVAACDKRPLAIVVGRTEAERQRLSQALAPVAWSDQFIGKMVYSSASANDLKTVRGANISSGYVFVEPNLFGTEATARVQLGPGASKYELENAVKSVIGSYRPQRLSHHDHVRLGHMNGIGWQTAIPVTDPHSPQLRQRAW